MNTQDSTVVMPLTAAEQIKSRIIDLQDQLRKMAPEYESNLHYIHRALAVDPETVQLLTNEEIGVIVAGLARKTGVTIAAETVSKTGKGKNKINVEDL